MTDHDVIVHWQRGARNEWQAASILCEGAQYPAALFHCHLAIEKALKAAYMQQHKRHAPLTHDLLQIALQLDRTWTPEEKTLLAELTEYAVVARYDDPAWAAQEATAEVVRRWLERVDDFLHALCP